ncbi:MAG: PQQ-dependent sugar dehydrogenase [Ardenticatenaceae bacterium]|nr:PQQ-dependent sugar dehydrogenase [Ardenticatenaceae bacterium]
MYQKLIKITFLLVTLTLFGCTQAADPTPAATAVTPATEPATAVPQPTETLTVDNSPASEATPTPTATTASNAAITLANTATNTPIPTATLIPTPTATATETPTPAPTANLEPITGVAQPPYAASICSDKYPCNDDIAAWEARIQVPAGFTASYFAHLEGNPTSMTFGPDGRLYVAMQAGTIYALDADGRSTVYASGFNTPTGIAFQPGTNNLFVSSRVRDENVGGEAQVSIANGPQILSGLPCCYTYLHAANGIAFGPDGYGYVSVGGRADHGEILDGSNQQDERHPLEAAILRFNPNGGEPEVYARGLRNAYDITWDANGQLFATDNSPDYGPPERLHRIVPGGEHGYPWYTCDTCFSPPAGTEIIPPVYEFIPHSSPTGVTVYLAEQFPGYFNSLFVTLWSAFPGAQKVVRLIPGGTSGSDFAMGFAAPIDVTVAPDGSLYVVDWATGIIFKISYTG